MIITRKTAPYSNFLVQTSPVPKEGEEKTVPIPEMSDAEIESRSKSMEVCDCKALRCDVRQQYIDNMKYYRNWLREQTTK